MMLTFKIIRVEHGPGSTAPVLLHDSGVRRRASEEEAALWEALLLERAKVAALMHPERYPAPSHGTLEEDLASIRHAADTAIADMAETGKAPDSRIPEGVEVPPGPAKPKKGR